MDYFIFLQILGKQTVGFYFACLWPIFVGSVRSDGGWDSALPLCEADQGSGASGGY